MTSLLRDDGGLAYQFVDWCYILHPVVGMNGFHLRIA